METPSFSQKKKNKKKIIITSIAVGAVGVLGYFGWQYWKKRKAKNASSADLLNLLKPSSSSSLTDDTTTSDFVNSQIAPSKPKREISSGVSSGKESTRSVFPLQKGSKGEKVRLLQKALIDKYGPSILPTYGADGSFGQETITALQKAGLPATLTENDFNLATQGVVFDGTSVGRELFLAVDTRNFGNTLSLLQKMNNTNDYKAANEVFKMRRLNGLHRQTIVNGVLNTYTDEEQQQKIKFEFLRIGLQFANSKWNLPTLGGLPIITIRPASIWTNGRNRVNVPSRVVLGNEISKRLDYTLFENQGKYFLVPTDCVRYL